MFFAYKNTSLLLRVLQAFLSFMLPAVRSALLTLLAFLGQTAIQRIQEMQALESVSDGFSKGIARTGHSFAQRPQLMQDFPAEGFIVYPKLSLYLRWD